METVVRNNTMVSDSRIKSLTKCLEIVDADNIEGDFAECGTWRGGLAALMLHYISTGDVRRKLYIYDTFQGMTKPTEVDGGALKMFGEHANDGEFADWCKAGVDEVKATLAEVDKLFEAKCILVEGKVEDTLNFKANLPYKIALLRLDTDWYQSTKKEFEVLWPLVVTNGIVIVDDYSDWPGCRMAVDEYLKDVRHNRELADGSLVITKL